MIVSCSARKKKKMADKVLPPRIRDLVPESQAYMDLLAFERKLDATIMRKRLDIQEALKRPMKVCICPSIPRSLPRSLPVFWWIYFVYTVKNDFKRRSFCLENKYCILSETHVAV